MSEMVIRTKPLNQSERKTLEKIVDNDFENLRQELRQMATEAKNVAKEQIEKEYSGREKAAKEARDKLITLRRKWEDEGNKILDTLEEKGVIASDGYKGREKVSITVPQNFEPSGKKEALEKVESQVNGNLNRAIRLLESKRLAMQKQVLLTGIASEAAYSLLESMPDAATLLLEAQEEQKQLST